MLSILLFDGHVIIFLWLFAEAELPGGWESRVFTPFAPVNTATRARTAGRPGDFPFSPIYHEAEYYIELRHADDIVDIADAHIENSRGRRIRAELSPERLPPAPAITARAKYLLLPSIFDDAKSLAKMIYAGVTSIYILKLPLKRGGG